jgi:four helix bundle suffix protein
MDNDKKKRIIPVSKDYKKLWCYQKAEAIYDITFYFIYKYLPLYGDRTFDQMRQAARSGKQNILEGSIDGAASSKMEIDLVIIAKGSLKELLGDYEDYLRARKLRIWEDDSVEVKAMRKIAAKHNDSAYYMKIVETRSAETIANIALCLLKQTDYLLAKYLEKLGEQFLREGGRKEQMTALRLEERRKQASQQKKP